MIQMLLIIDELQNNLEKLQKKIPNAMSEVSRLAEMGDFSENAAYQMAKGRLRSLHRRIKEFETQLKHSAIIENKKNTDSVHLGQRVTVEFNGNTKTFQILGQTETNPSAGIISRHSPLGSLLLNKKVGDIIEVQSTNKLIKYQIVSID